MSYPGWGPGPPMYISSVDEMEKWHLFQKKLQDEQRDQDKKKKEKERAPKTFTFIEVFTCLLLASLPVGMVSSYLMLNGIKMWVVAMSGMIK